MIEKEFVPEFMLRTRMLLRSLPALKKELLLELKQKKIVPFRKVVLMDSIDVLNAINTKEDFDYYDAFVFILCFSKKFEDLAPEIKSGEHDLKTNFYREDYWKQEDILYKDALFFCYPYLNETYKTEMSIDLKKLSEKIDRLSTNKNLNITAKYYVDFVKKIRKKAN